MAQSTDHSAEHHIIPISTLAKTLGALACLMFLTILVYKVDFGHILSSKLGLGSAAGSYINNAIALTIATIKMVIVIQFFMGVKYVTKLTKLWAWTGFVWMLLLGLTYGDYATRHWEPIKGWNHLDTDTSPGVSQITDRPAPKVEHGEEEH